MAGDQTAKGNNAVQNSNGEAGDRVQIKIFAMSLCPYFAKLVSTIHPLVGDLSDRLDITLEYLGAFTDEGFDSMHGQEEIKVDIMQLCAQQVASAKNLFDFIACQYRDTPNIFSSWTACAESSGIDPVILEGCYNGAEGKKLLRESFARSRDAGIDRSPVIYINGLEYQEGILRTSIARALCRELGEPKPKTCAEYSSSQPIRITVLSDKRCKKPECDSKTVEEIIGRMVNNPVFEHIDYLSEKGEELFQKSGVRFLPLAVFDASLLADQDSFSNIEPYLLFIGDSYVLPIGRSFEPIGEICDDKEDNDSDSTVDCSDSDCASLLICKEDNPRSIRLFIMSYCPYCTVALSFAWELLLRFNRNREQIDFRIEFVGTESDGDLYSLHGDKEIEENLRQICFQKHYSGGYKFMDYIKCRNQRVSENKSFDNAQESWRSCVPEGVSTSIIERCMIQGEGRKLLADSFKLSRSLEINGSPVWLINNRYKIIAGSAEEVLQTYCQANPGLKACSD